ncbi:GNAT family N-acetyltransferase [Exiguobacterium flavidum]|uniref:GNAT family N-acetyltransferase n=1 Tax=Exiguobacterium flavidum TaxID=2184695 RepID=UPI002FCD6BB7
MRKGRRNDMSDVKLAMYANEHYDQCDAFILPEEQLQYSAYPTQVVSDALEDPDKFPVVIKNGEDVVGFFILHKNPPKTHRTDDKSILLRAFSIDARHQKQGYAKEAMLQLPDFVRANFPEMTAITLAVNKKNIAAKSLYFKTGFFDTLQSVSGPIGEQHILAYDMKKEP